VDLVGFAKSVTRDLVTETKKWAKGSTTLEFGSFKRCVTHIQGVVIFMIFILVMGGMFSYQAGAIKVGAVAAQESGGGGGGKPVSYDGWTAQAGASQETGTATEAQPGDPMQLSIEDKNLASVTFTLKWKDEPDQYPRHTNTPDTLGVDATAPWGANQTASGKNVYSASGGEGTVTVTFEVVQTKYNGVNGTGTWQFTVFCTDAGDHMPKNVGLLKWIDSGNDYTLDINWKYYTKPGK
jgi:hypothetical protein